MAWFVHPLIQIEGVLKGFANYLFGFSSLTNEYKVLQFISVDPSGEWTWKVGYWVVEHIHNRYGFFVEAIVDDDDDDTADSYCLQSAGVFVDKSWKQDMIVLWILKDYQNLGWFKETINKMLGGTYGGGGWLRSSFGYNPHRFIILMDLHRDLTAVHSNCFFMI
ncbi:PREDICTED: F-box [Prunus dulcis]|uniref:PREDICTED: F-box n=1 Tax=Prunus dulcis TaxID=3755 RepID=A0A5E4F8T2_PRUDU|nr:hypothetical protein L3X38_005723 [Prunus dulcis]VVA24132.1 PREDICTED: F-box [Prunus dulcis]